MIDDGAERALISMMLQSPLATDVAQGKLQEECFLVPLHAQIYTMLCGLPRDGLWTNNHFADKLGLKLNSGEYAELQQLSVYNLMGPPKKFKSMGYDTVILDCIRIISNKYKRRFLAAAAAKLLQDSKDPNIDIPMFIAALSAIQERMSSGEQSKTWMERNQDWLALLEERYEHRNDPRSLLTGMPTLDKCISKFNPGELIIVSAKYKVGKSALMLSIVDHATVAGKVPCLVISLEMAVNQWMDRLYSHRSGIDALRISEGTFREQDFPVITGVMNTVREAPLNVEDRDCSTVSQIESLLRYHKLKNNIRYAAIDHVQLVQSTPDKNNRGMERKDQLDAFGSKLKDLSKALDITIFLLSQVNDAGVTFGSQMLLAHADKVIKMEIPDRKEFPAGMDEKNTRRVTVELNRSGITGSVMARFDGSTCHFGELRNNDEPEVRAQTAERMSTVQQINDNYNAGMEERSLPDRQRAPVVNLDRNTYRVLLASGRWVIMTGPTDIHSRWVVRYEGPEDLRTARRKAFSDNFEQFGRTVYEANCKE